MSDKVSTAREALLAELIGDMRVLLDQVGDLREALTRADTSTRETAKALESANAAYREQLNDMLARLRVEFAQLLLSAAEKSARSLVGQQTEVLQQAALVAVREALTSTAIRRARRDWLRLVVVGSVVGGIVAATVTLVFLRSLLPA